MNGASHQARSVAAITPAPVSVCSSLRRDSELRSSILDPPRGFKPFRAFSGSCLMHHATACWAGEVAKMAANKRMQAENHESAFVSLGRVVARLACPGPTHAVDRRRARLSTTRPKWPRSRARLAALLQTKGQQVGHETARQMLPLQYRKTCERQSARQPPGRAAVDPGGLVILPLIPLGEASLRFPT